MDSNKTILKSLLYGTMAIAFCVCLYRVATEKKSTTEKNLTTQNTAETQPAASTPSVTTAPETTPTTAPQYASEKNSAPTKRASKAQKIEPKALETPDELDDEASAQEDREAYELEMLRDPKTGKIPDGAASNALKAAAQTKEFYFSSSAENLSGLTITPRGPDNLGGRTRALGIDVRNANIMIAGSVSSGIFRSTNGGANWTRVTPLNDIHNITAIAQDPRPGFQNTWYAGGGESSGNSAALGSSSIYYGHGIWRSVDNGQTWTSLPSTRGALETFDSPFDYTHRLVVDPTNGYIYAAASDVIMRSTDGGSNWSAVLGTFNNSRYSDIIVTPSGRFYAGFHGADGSEGVWTSTTGESGSWTKIAGASSATNPADWNAASGYGRVVLAYAPSDPNIVFALYYNNITYACTGTPTPEAELFRWNQSTQTWVNLSANLPDEAGCLAGNDPFAVQTGYDLVVAVKPDNPDVVFIGGTNVYRSTDGFTSTTNTRRIGGYVSSTSYGLYANHHPDIHALVFHPSDANTLYCGSDGGIHSADITATTVAWNSLNNNYITYQYYHIDIDPTDGSNFVSGGAQDNGTTGAGSGASHSALLGGDGCATGVISYNSPTSFNVVASTQNGSLFRLNAPNSGFSIRPSGSTGSIFVTYFHLDQDNANYLYYVSGTSLYRTRTASTLSATTVTSNSATGWELMTGMNVGSNIRAIATSRNAQYSGAYAASNSGRKLYFGTSGGGVYRLNDPAFAAASATPVNISPSGGSGIVSSIAVNPFNDNEIIVTYANYGVASVFHTRNANAATPTWTNVEGPTGDAVALSSARSSAIVNSNGTTVYLVGTSTGLYCAATLNGTSTVWDRVGANEINYALCSQMRYRVSDNQLLVGTHGNGMFLLGIPGTALPLDLLSFKGQNDQKKNVLNWETARETNVKGFEIQKSYDGSKDFVPMGFVKAQNTASARYNFVDNNVLQNGVQYYRLKLIDNDGKFRYSKTIAIETNGKTAPQYVVAPNPVADKINVNFDAPIEGNRVSVRVFDIQGKQYLDRVFDDAQGSNLQIDVPNLSSGVYLISVQQGNNNVQTTKFVKQ